jgi:DNA-binding winged helix-turn-helix (wHTH) protein
MKYKISTYNWLILFSGAFGICILCTLFLIGVLEYLHARTEMKHEIFSSLEESIRDEAELKMKDVFQYVQILNDPEHKDKKMRRSTVVTEDTTITKEVKIEENFTKELLKNYQSYLLVADRLNPDTLRDIFHSKLNEKKIHTHPAILVSYNGKTKLEGDTVQWPVNYRTPVIKGGVFEEISYQGFIHYTPATAFLLMSKNALIALFVLEIILLVFLCRLIREKNKIAPDKIVKLRNHDYYIGLVYFDTKKMELFSKNKSVKLTNQTGKILLLFLQNDDYMVTKNEIQTKFWPTNSQSSAYHNMTTAINKLRCFLKEIECSFIIDTKKGADYYVLTHINGEKQSYQNETINNLSPDILPESCIIKKIVT